MILALAGRVAPDLKPDQAIEIMLAEEWSLDGNGKSIGDQKKSKADPFVVAVANDILREGFEIKTGGEHKQGIRLRVVGKDTDIDLSDEALSDLILKYLTPRFRSIAQGIEE